MKITKQRAMAFAGDVLLYLALFLMIAAFYPDFFKAPFGASSTHLRVTYQDF